MLALLPMLLLLPALACPAGATLTTAPAERLGGKAQVCVRGGDRHGPSRVLHPTENRLLREQRWHNGVRHGVARTWHRNGQLAEKATWHEGQLHGVWEHWDERGQTDGRGLFDQGRGLMVRWHANGLRKAWGRLEASEQHGLWTFWHDTGKRSQQVTYDHGRYHGVLTGWHRNGAIAVRMTYRHGAEHGVETRWSEGDPKQKIKIVERNWQFGKAHGLTLYWRPDGRFKEARCFVWQRLRGIWRERDLRRFDEEGPLTDAVLVARARKVRCLPTRRPAPGAAGKGRP